MTHWRVMQTERGRSRLHCVGYRRGFTLNRNRISSNGQSIEYEVVHRPAVTRRIHLELNPQGDLQVVAPRRMSKRAIQRSLQMKAGHVARFLVEARVRQQQIPSYRYETDELHYFMGQEYPLHIEQSRSKRIRVECTRGVIRMCLPQPGPASVKAALVRWYRQQAQSHFFDRLTWFSQVACWTGGNPPEMRLRLMKRTWGSCSSKGVITLNPRLVKAPSTSIDYVIAHEICHLREHNHGKAFYELQAQLFPNWQEAKAHLNEKAHIYIDS